MHLIHRAEDAVPDLSLLAGRFAQVCRRQPVHALKARRVRADFGQKVEQRRKLILKRPGFAQRLAEVDKRGGQPRANGLHLGDFGLRAAPQWPQKARAAQAVADGVVHQPVALVGGDRHQSRLNEGEHVLLLEALFQRPERRQQAFRGGVARGGAAGGQ